MGPRWRACIESARPRTSLVSPSPSPSPIRGSSKGTQAPWPAIVVALSVSVLCACTGKDPYNPGESLGTFTVEAKRAAASCGEAQTPPDPWKFDVRLSQEGRTLYWIQGGAPVHGTLDANNRTEMKSADARTLREASKGRSACVVRREDALEATLTATPTSATASAPNQTKLDVKSFSGKLAYRFIPEDGSDCQDMLENGTFAELPCEMSFTLAGAPKAKSTK